MNYTALLRTACYTRPNSFFRQLYALIRWQLAAPELNEIGPFKQSKNGNTRWPIQKSKLDAEIVVLQTRSVIVFSCCWNDKKEWERLFYVHTPCICNLGWEALVLFWTAQCIVWYTFPSLKASRQKLINCILLSQKAILDAFIRYECISVSNNVTWCNALKGAKGNSGTFLIIQPLKFSIIAQKSIVLSLSKVVKCNSPV